MHHHRDTGSQRYTWPGCWDGLIIPGGTDRQRIKVTVTCKRPRQAVGMERQKDGEADRKLSRSARKAGRQVGRQQTFQIMRGCHRLRGQVP